MLVENYFSEEFVKYLISIGCDKNYFKDTFVSSTAYNHIFMQQFFPGDFYSQRAYFIALKPDDYKDTKYASIYLEENFFDDFLM